MTLLAATRLCAETFPVGGNVTLSQAPLLRPIQFLWQALAKGRLAFGWQAAARHLALLPLLDVDRLQSSESPLLQLAISLSWNDGLHICHLEPSLLLELLNANSLRLLLPTLIVHCAGDHSNATAGCPDQQALRQHFGCPEGLCRGQALQKVAAQPVPIDCFRLS